MKEKTVHLLIDHTGGKKTACGRFIRFSREGVAKDTYWYSNGATMVLCSPLTTLTTCNQCRKRHEQPLSSGKPSVEEPQSSPENSGFGEDTFDCV